jgi:hypothetical protein
MWDDEAATVEAKIAAVDTVSDVTVKFQEWGGTACTEYGHAFTVEFTQDFGDLPLMYADWSKLTHDVVSGMHDGCLDKTQYAVPGLIHS